MAEHEANGSACSNCPAKANDELRFLCKPGIFRESIRYKPPRECPRGGRFEPDEPGPLGYPLDVSARLNRAVKRRNAGRMAEWLPSPED